MRTYPHEDADELRAAGIERIERPKRDTYPVTIAREPSPPNSGSPSGRCWVARDSDGAWRNYCDLSFAETAGAAVAAMFHANEIESVDDRGDTATANIRTN